MANSKGDGFPDHIDREGRGYWTDLQVSKPRHRVKAWRQPDEDGRPRSIARAIAALPAGVIRSDWEHCQRLAPVATRD